MSTAEQCTSVRFDPSSVYTLATVEPEGAYFQIPLNLVGDISVYRTVWVMEACPRYACSVSAERTPFFVSVRETHLAHSEIGPEDGVHLADRWTPRWREQPMCAAATARS
jgi:hypothetical protein